MFTSSLPTIAQSSSSDQYRVLEKEEIGLSLNTVEKFLKNGDELFLNEEFAEARKKYDKARDMSKLLLGFYSDLSSSFKGVDALIPREMDSNSRKVLSLISKANLRLPTYSMFFAPNSIRLFFDIVLDGMHKSKS